MTVSSVLGFFLQLLIVSTGIGLMTGQSASASPCVHVSMISWKPISSARSARRWGRRTEAVEPVAMQRVLDVSSDGKRPRTPVLSPLLSTNGWVVFSASSKWSFQRCVSRCSSRKGQGCAAAQLDIIADTHDGELGRALGRSAEVLEVTAVIGRVEILAIPALLVSALGRSDAPRGS